MNEKEIKVRKEWLAIIVVLVVSNFVFNLMYFRNDPSINAMPDEVKYWVTGASLLVPFIFYYFVYLCAYKKPGTKLLMFLLIATPISLVMTIGGYVSGLVPLPANPYFWVSIIFSSGLLIRLWFLHLKMRAINKKLQVSSKTG